MQAPRTKAFGPARIAALALISLTTLGLAYLHFSRGSDAISVPFRAHAGELKLHACRYTTENGSYRADCGTLVVPENRQNAHSRLIALPVTRIRARSAHPGVPIFRLEGGPGISNMKFANASRFAADHDVVLVGYRGIDGSVRLDCPEVESALEHSTDFLGTKSLHAYGDAFRSCARRLTTDGIDLAGYGLTQQVDDLEAARKALGYTRIDLLSDSAGTRTAMIYSWRYPKSIDRSVMIAVNPPGNFLWNAKATDEQIRNYSALCAADESCSKRSGNLAASIKRATADIPGHWFFLPIKKGNVRLASFYGLMESTAESAPLSAPITLSTLLSADHGDASGLWFQSLLADFAFPTSFVWGQMAAAGRADAAVAKRHFAPRHHRAESILGDPGTRFIWGGGSLADAWPANANENEYDHVRTSNVNTLLIGGELDLATPPQIATQELLPYLPNGHQIVLTGLGHTTSFWSEQPRASSHLINTFFDSGRVDDSLYKPISVDFTPEVTQTALGKGIAGSMVGFAVLTVLSLLWMPRRVHTRGRFGRKASATLRSVYPIVLGLGGWFTGVLIVITTMPGTPLDDELLAAFSVGLPIGLGVYFAWVHRAWTIKSKAIGFAAAVGGALVGARLGFQAADGLLALVTAIAGAAVGGNLTLLGLDLAWQSRQTEFGLLPEYETGSSAGTSSVPTSLRRPVRDALVASAVSSNQGGTSMSRTTQHSNLAARVGRWSAAHWKTATFGWLALVVVAFAVGGQVGTKQADPTKAGPGESGRMDKILQAGFKLPASESVLVQSRSDRVGSPSFDAAVKDVVARVAAVAVVQNVRSPLDPANPGQIAPGRHAALVEFDIRGDSTKAMDKLDPVLKSVDDAQSSHPDFFVGEFGDASAPKAVNTAFAHDLQSAGIFSIPLTLIILVIAFGALVAAGIPLLLALTAVFATFGAVALPSHLIPLAPEAFAVVLLVGLAVGVDYSMFYLRREREERAAGRSARAALEAAAATSGRSVLISGLTVMVAMAGLFLTGDATFASFGYATMIVVAFAVVGSLTVLPALLSKLGDRVERLHVPLVGRLRRDKGEGRIWGAIVDRVLRRPLLSAVIAGGLLLALAAPALQLRMATPGPDTFPGYLDVVKTYNRMQEAFPGKALPATVVVKAPNVDAPSVRQAIGRLEAAALATGRAREPITSDTNSNHTIANITIPILGKGTDAQSNASLAALRKDVLPQTVGALPNVESGVTGLTAEWKDAKDQLHSKLPFVVGFVLLFAFALMLVAFRSIVVAIKAIVLNLLSVAAGYGVLVLVFQHGIGKGLLGFSSTAGIDPVTPLLLFVILFGLSMDYHVFIISRIRETFDGGATMDDAIAHGIKSTAGVVTSAAVVMVAVFSIFATLSMLIFKQFGVGLAAAILIDATLVRGVLLPATMKLLGEKNWYLPGWLQWLPRFGPEEPPPAPEAMPVPASA